MKKMMWVVLGLLLGASAISAAEFKPYAGDGYFGYARADYLGTTRDFDPVQTAERSEQFIRRLGHKITGYCQKLSKEEHFLLWKALEEYDYSDNEVYSVSISKDSPSTAAGFKLELIAVIKDKGQSVEWYGGFYYYYDYSSR